jgi:glycosyltransferase involved in cell wall biosynthesis
VKISALIPTYNRRSRIFRAVDSVLAQTVAADEIIVVDDGSTDGTSEAIKAHYGEDCRSRIRVIRQENQGVSAARMRAVHEAQGDWVAFLDSDDLWHPTKLEKQLSALLALGNDYGASFTNCDYIGRENYCTTVFEEGGLKTDAEYGPIHQQMKYIVGSNGNCNHSLVLPSLMARRSLILEAGGFNPSIGYSEDRDFLFRLAQRTRFCYVAAPLVSIDRESGLPRLTGLMAKKTSKTHEWLERVLLNMRAQPEWMEQAERDSLEQEIILLYYKWAGQNLSAFRFSTALTAIKKIRAMGPGYLRIGWTLLARALKKLQRSIWRCTKRDG